MPYYNLENVRCRLKVLSDLWTIGVGVQIVHNVRPRGMARMAAYGDISKPFSMASVEDLPNKKYRFYCI